MLEGRWKGCSKGFQRWKGMLEGCQKGAGRGSSAGRVRWKGFQRWNKGSSRVPATSSIAERFQQGFEQGFQQVLYHPFHLHSVLFYATVGVWPQVVQRNESVAEPQAQGNRAACVVDSVLVAWQAREVVT